MELREVIETTGTCRYYRPDPVSDDVLARVLSAARFAPTGGNMQPVRFVVVRDAGTRKRLHEIYLPLWRSYLESTARNRVEASNRAEAGSAAQAPPPASMMRMVANANHFAEHLHEVPVHVVVCVALGDILATDAGLGRLSVVGGASIYPSVQNLLLAARNEGLGAALTTLLCYAEAEVKELLEIPDEIATAALVALGHPARPFPSRLARRPLERVAFAERYGTPFVASPS
jgi:nitroreductase